MMTLDDVIEAMERCSIPHYFDCKGCPYEDDDAEVGCRSDDRDADALHYLKTYRENQQTYIENSRKAEEARERYLEAVRNCELAENKYNQAIREHDMRSMDALWKIANESNDPLTWDELQKMPGMPVWIIDANGKGKWYLVKAILHDEAVFTDAWGCSGIGYPRDFDQKTWQAYRKERSDVVQ